MVKHQKHTNLTRKKNGNFAASEISILGAKCSIISDLVDQFSSIKNVGRILVGGLRELSIRVWVDPIKLAANDLTIKEVELAMRGENISLPAGTLEADNIDLTLNLDKSYTDINSIKQLPIKKTGNKIILLFPIFFITFKAKSISFIFAKPKEIMIGFFVCATRSINGM